MVELNDLYFHLVPNDNKRHNAFKCGNLKRWNDRLEEVGIRNINFQWPHLWTCIIPYCVIFHLFQLSSMSDENFVVKLKSEGKGRSEKKKHYAWTKEKETSWKNGCCRRQSKEKKPNSTFIICKFTTSSSPSSSPDYDPRRHNEESLHCSIKTRVKLRKNYIYFKNKGYFILKLCWKWWCYWTSKTRTTYIFFMEEQRHRQH